MHGDSKSDVSSYCSYLHRLSPLSTGMCITVGGFLFIFILTVRKLGSSFFHAKFSILEKNMLSLPLNYVWSYRKIWNNVY